MKSYAGIVGVLLAGWALGGVAARAQGFPDGPGKAIVQEACSVCHETELITAARRSKAEWTETVEDMVSRGAPLKEGEREMVIEYLAKNFGPDKPAAQGVRNEQQLPVVASAKRQQDSAPFRGLVLRASLGAQAVWSEKPPEGGWGAVGSADQGQ